MVLYLTSREYVKFRNVGHKFVYRSILFMTGFGYDSQKDNYKVVNISYDHIKCECTFHVMKCMCMFIALEATWRKLSKSPYDQYYGDWSSGC